MCQVPLKKQVKACLSPHSCSRAWSKFIPSFWAELASSRSTPPEGFFGFRFLVCIPSFRIASGRFTPCSLKYNPHALQTGSPSLFRRQRVVVRVPQFVQHRPKRLVAVCKISFYIHIIVTHSICIYFLLFSTSSQQIGAQREANEHYFKKELNFQSNEFKYNLCFGI